MADAKVYERLTELGIDRDRLASSLAVREDWGGMVSAFEYLTVLGVVLDCWPKEVSQ
jgi:hypothetical protein